MTPSGTRSQKIKSRIGLVINKYFDFIDSRALNNEDSIVLLARSIRTLSSIKTVIVNGGVPSIPSYDDMDGENSDNVISIYQKSFAFMPIRINGRIIFFSPVILSRVFEKIDERFYYLRTEYYENEQEVALQILKTGIKFIKRSEMKNGKNKKSE